MNNEDEENCPKCGCPIHPCLPCEEVVALNGNLVDYEYCRLLEDILEMGRRKKNRTGVDTIGIFGAQAKFDVKLDAFPILTTKKVWFKGIVHELLWFIRGDTNIKYLVDNGVHIWDEWAYKRYTDANKINGKFEDDKWFRYFKGSQRVATKEEADNLSMYPIDEFIEKIKNDDEFANRWGNLGEGTYGGMWRAFPFWHGAYSDWADDKPFIKWTTNDSEFGVDQLGKVMDKLKTNPDDRRMIVTAWHPYYVDHCALPPCHCMFHFNTEELSIDERYDYANSTLKLSDSPEFFNAQTDDDFVKWMDRLKVPKRKLNLLLYQRSCDTFLGVPFNITSYCLLLAMVAHCVNMAPGEFTHTYGDLHIYENHMEQVKEQLARTPKQLPKLVLNPNVKDLFSFKYEDISLVGYDPHPAIKAEVAV